MPIIYLHKISFYNCPDFYKGSLLCLITSVLNHGFDNLYYKENESKTFMVQFLIWIDRIVCHYYIFYFIINTYNNDIFWILTINCGLTIGYIYIIINYNI